MNKEETIKESIYKGDIDSFNDLIIDSIQDIKGSNILKLDLTKLEDGPTDYFIICEGDSTTQVRAIANNIKARVKEETKIRIIHMEGLANSTWILIDFFDTIVHIFHPETRAFYEIEDLWSDAVVTNYEDI